MQNENKAEAEEKVIRNHRDMEQRTDHNGAKRTQANVMTEEATDTRKTNTFRQGTARADSDRRVLEDQVEETNEVTTKATAKEKPFDKQ